MKPIVIITATALLLSGVFTVTRALNYHKRMYNHDSATAAYDDYCRHLPPYFPAGAFSNSLLSTWYSGMLATLQEPILYDKNCGDTEIYRFTMLPTFYHPLCVRLEKHADNYVLFWKMCDGAGGYTPGNLIVNEERTLSKQEWNDFLMRFNQLNFQNMGTEDGSRNFVDGSEWIFEGKSKAGYHVVTRTSPKNYAPAYFKCGKYLLQLTGMKFKKYELY